MVQVSKVDTAKVIEALERVRVHIAAEIDRLAAPVVGEAFGGTFIRTAEFDLVIHDGFVAPDEPRDGAFYDNPVSEEYPALIEQSGFMPGGGFRV